MANRDKLPKIADVEREALFGYVFGVSGPGMTKKTNNLFNKMNIMLTLHFFYFSRHR